MSRIEKMKRILSHRKAENLELFKLLGAQAKILEQQIRNDTQSQVQTLLGLEKITGSLDRIETMINACETTRARANPCNDFISRSDDENDQDWETCDSSDDELTEEMSSTLEHRQNHPSTCPPLIIGRSVGSLNIGSDRQQQEPSISNDKSAKDDCRGEGDMRNQSHGDERNMAAKRLRRESNNDGTTDISKLMDDGEIFKKESTITKVGSSNSNLHQEPPT